MVVIYDNFVVGDVGDGVQQVIIFFVFIAMFELYVDFNVIGEQVVWFDCDQGFIVVVESFFWLQFDFKFFVYVFVLQFNFDVIEDVVVVVVEIGQWMFVVVDKDVFVVGYVIFECDNCVFGDLYE